MIPGNIPLILAGGSNEYSVAKSMRFRTGSSALYKTLSSSGNVDKWTYSVWIKRTDILGVKNSFNVLLAATIGGNPYYQSNFMINSSDQLTYYQFTNSTGYTVNVSSTGLLRDTSAWYHIVLKYDRLESNMVAWVNNSEFINTSSYSTSIQYINSSSATQYIGNYTYQSDPSGNFDGYMAEVNFIDNQALTPSSFGQTDSTTGVWVPKKYLGTYTGTSGYLQFANSSNFGVDTSGLANNWTQYAGVASTDQMTDTPTLNYAVMSMVDKGASMSTSNGSLRISNTSGGSFERIRSSIGMTSGKWYAEFVIDTEGAPSRLQAGLMTGSAGITTSYLGNGDALSWSIYESGGSLYKVTNSTATLYVSGGTLDPTDVHMLAYDADAGKFWYGKNGTWFASGNPASGTDEMFSSVSVSGQAMFFASSAYNSSDLGTWNFGQRPFAYTPPSGFKALNTANLSVPTIKKPSTLMSVATYTGNGSTQSISSLAFQPDLVWIKSRSAATTTNIFDSQRGVQKSIQSTGPNAEYTDANTLTAFNSTGFSLGSDASSRGVNVNTATYVAWTWKESVEAGLDIVLYTGNGGGARNIAHGLGVAPKWMFVRGRDARVWAGWHTNLTSAAYYMDLGTAAAEFVDTTMFDSTAPDASNFRVGSYNNVNAVNYVAYLWSEVAGFSRFGSYVGNASADGPFVWCGFSPRWIIIKDRTAANLGWRIYDTVRETFNEMGGGLETASAAAESYATSVRAIDVLSNGFKIRVSASGLNGSGATFVFAAFAEAPFKYARAR
jgi:hypothetical protein